MDRKQPRRLEDIPIAELMAVPVWKYALDAEVELGETAVRPVTEIPVHDLPNHIVATKVRLANGTFLNAILGNIDLQNVKSTQQSMVLSVERDGEWFHLANYYEFYKEMGPDGLAKFLGLPVEEVFPITYDISKVAIGAPEVVKGTIPKEPPERLSDEERRELG